MIFHSKIHGEIEYDEKNIVDFLKSIPGFDEDLRKFIVVDLKGMEPFKLLQSLEDDKVGLVVVSPFDFCDKYEVDLSQNIIKELDIKESKDVMLLTTVTLNSDPKKITTNLRAPIIMNISNRLGKQIILNNEDYAIKHPLIKE
ncbi:flagellar assembly protein FliW [Clostridium weizhouense]|uniref:Flagellar assembly factor FliW n=1 Tax=Clostridium weizhouense TaxID=2859781 RepID=A0ABS7AIU5_9CLOT|nr:flagellar assembly protein FliW [Clostridium weizhouense]MBW6408588.1 flagellar assembly protein FliW [Clostridium weizhouense]